MTLTELIRTISKLSTDERACISNTEVLDQPRNLRINTLLPLNMHDFEYIVNLCNGVVYILFDGDAVSVNLTKMLLMYLQKCGRSLVSLQ